jgi:hypothetical protein
MKYITFLFFIIFTLTLSCKQKAEKIKTLNISKALSEKYASLTSDTITAAQFSFSKVVPIDQWDQLIVIPPYSELSQRHTAEISNAEQTAKQLQNSRLSEELCALLFLWKKKVIGIALVPRLPIDFMTLAGDSINKSFSKNESNHFFLKRKKNKDEERMTVHFGKADFL